MRDKGWTNVKQERAGEGGNKAAALYTKMPHEDPQKTQQHTQTEAFSWTTSVYEGRGWHTQGRE